MIPIKWDGTYWVITTKDDVDWYDYSQGKWANVMLSDNIYSSELEQNKTLAVAGTQVLPSELGTIYTWIPRLAYSDTQIEFLKGLSVIDYKWTTESCFNLEKYGANELDLGFEGIWVGQTEYTSLTEVENKNNAMNSEDNTYGLIVNEKVQTLTDSDKTAVQKLYEKYSGITENETMIKNVSSMENRQTIKVVNTNKRLPITGTHVVSDVYIIVKDKYSENKIEYVIDENGNKLQNNNMATIDEDEINYTFYLVDSVGNIRRYTMSYGAGRPYLKGFNKSNTFYVVYDENGNEDSSIPIGETAPDNWYDYKTQMWANIVVRDNGNENYYTWIPRYMYTLNNDEQTVNAVFVDLDNKDIETGKSLEGTEYKLPEAFTWVDPDNPNNVVQLTGFWASKYKLRDTTTDVPDISGGSGVIRVNNISQATNSSYTCEMYLIKDGKRIAWDDATNAYIENTNSMQLTGNYIYKNVEPGTYTVNIIVKNASTGLQVKGIANEVVVTERVEPNKPDVSSFVKSNTFYVVYDENGNEDSSIPIGEEPPANWYDYDSSNWANIVVRYNGNENYYTWIPRYEYKVNEALEKTNVLFIPTIQETADVGYQIPEAFTWSDGTTTTPLSGFWASKYKLREGATDELGIYGGNKIISINNISEATNSSYICEMYLIKDGKRIVWDESQNKYVEGTGSITLTGEYTFENVEPGTYTVNIIVKNKSTGLHVKGIANDVEVIDTGITEPNAPDVTGFMVDTTFVVVYDESGNEDATQSVKSVLADGAKIENGALVSGQIDISKISGLWYDYDNQIWANIVTINDGYTNYFTWIPRYEYKTNATLEKTIAIFIPITQTEADSGYQIPEAFTWNDGTTTRQLSGFWASKYKLR